MSFYIKRGEVPKKRHIAFKKPKADENGPLYFEELMSREGFSSSYSNLYHLAMPTRVKQLGSFIPYALEAIPQETFQHRARHLKTAAFPRRGDGVEGRFPLFFNDEVAIYKAHPERQREGFYRNAHHDELIFVQKGQGVLETQFGNLEFGKGDYLVIPRGVISRLRMTPAALPSASLLIVESAGAIQTPKRYRNAHGQLAEHSPYSERDIRLPVLQAPVAQQGEFSVLTRLKGGFQNFTYDRHPFDVVGWDGTHYPWAFNIRDFDPIVGRIHQPPPVHQTFEGQGFVVCSFVSRPFDFHPEAIPAPYPHSNVDSDEILFYSEGEFMSRKGIEEESISFHPMGFAHGPQPGKYEESIGKKNTDELAVMLDTFHPLKVAVASETPSVDDPQYPRSWL